VLSISGFYVAQTRSLAPAVTAVVIAPLIAGTTHARVRIARPDRILNGFGSNEYPFA
jgi:hypothetical protein